MFYRNVTLLLAVLAFLLTGCRENPQTGAAAPLKSQAQAQTQSNTGNPSPDQAAVSAPAKKVYLTFDDGPNSHYTGLILDILKRYGVKATFVVVGGNVEKNPEVLKRIVNEGHNVVNHTYSHDYKKLYDSPEAFLADLERADRLIASYTGTGAKIFRAPGGPAKLDSSYVELLKKNGYRSLGWNVTSADSDPNGATPEQIIGNVKNGVARIENMKKEPIILMHDGTEINLKLDKPGASVQNYIKNRESDLVALPVIIEFLQARGYTFAGVDENTPPAW